VPVILRPPVDWRALPFQGMVPLPRLGTPVTTWQSQDDAHKELISNLHLLSQELVRSPPTIAPPPASKSRLNDVFNPDGVPGITFVETPEFRELKLCLNVPGRGLVIEGPSGVGKTTALKKACLQLQVVQAGAWV